MSSTFQSLLVCSLIWIQITNGRHLRRDLERKQDYEITRKVEEQSDDAVNIDTEAKQKESNMVIREVSDNPPAPVIENIEGDRNENSGQPFLKPPFLPRVPLERDLSQRSVLNTDISRASNIQIITQNEGLVEPIFGGLPPRPAQISQQQIPVAEQANVAPGPIPAQPQTVPLIVPPGTVPRPEFTSELFLPVFSQATARLSIPAGPVAPAPLSQPVPVGPPEPTVSPVALSPPVAPVQPVAQVPPVTQVPPITPVPPAVSTPVPATPPVAQVQETPFMKPSRYAAYLGDMFLKLMTQLLGRARLTLNRITGSPPISPELSNNGK